MDNSPVNKTNVNTTNNNLACGNDNINPPTPAISGKPENIKKLNVGGQAVLEGVMMRSRRFWSIAVRRPDRTIATAIFKEISIMNKKKILGFPFIRGIVALVENLSIGFNGQPPGTG